MNCRDFLKEFEDRSALTDAATRHLKDCADCQKINVVQTRVWQLIDKFEPVEAPNDFNFRVKARIAEAKPDTLQSPSFPLLRYVLGLSIAGLILALVVFKGVYSLDDKTVPQVAETNFQKPAETADFTAKSSAPQPVAANVSLPLEDKNSIAGISKPKIAPIENNTRLIAGKPKEGLQIKHTKDDGENFNGSQDSALSPLKVITPPGIPNSSKKVENPSNFESGSSLTIEQILSQLGIETVSSGGKREVKAIKQNSVGDRSGVKVGDTIDAIDGEMLTDKPLQSKVIEGKKLTIVRGAEKIEISLHN